MSIFWQTAVYFLCLLTSLLCAALLLKSYFATRVRLLLLSAVCFLLLSLNNLLVLFDLALLPSVDLLPYRHAAALAGVTVMLLAFTLDVE